jgi:hypothetical protein
MRTLCDYQQQQYGITDYQQQKYGITNNQQQQYGVTVIISSSNMV